MATQKMMAVTSSKQWIHFFRSERCPPTSNNLLSSKEDYVRDGILYRRLPRWPPSHAPQGGTNKEETADSLEVEVLEGEMHLDDSGRFDSRPQNILFRRLVILGSQSV
jgi:hypothetical protein